jgi:DnaK suppressor protein
MMAMYKTIEKMLITTRQELIEEIARNRKMEADDLKNEIGDIYDSADNERDRQLSHILNDRDRKKLIAIDEALARIEDGSYGICEECGKRITANRLKILPFALLCVPCQSEMEKQTGQFRKSDEEAPYKDLSVIETEEFEE